MNRRDFIASSALGLGAIRLGQTSAFADRFGDVHKRVALIGSGWYGKVDLFRLLQIAPVEVVSISDPDRNMAGDAAAQIASRQQSGKRPRIYNNYRDLLAEGDAEIVLIGSPDHWHALHAIDAMKAGADVYLQKPTGVDVVEGQALLAVAQRTGRVVQVGLQRRSTPHLIEAKERVIDAGLLGQVSHSDICCYYHMRRNLTVEEAPDIPAPEYLDFDLWTGPAPLRPFNRMIHPRGWRAFMEYGNGIVGDMCVHMLDTVRWMLDLGMPTKISSSGGILVQTESRANTTDTQTAIFEFPEMHVVWNHRSWGDAPDPDYPWAAFIYGEKGTLKLSVHKYEYFPQGERKPALAGTPLFEYDRFPIDETEKGLERHVASAIRWHMMDFLSCVETRERPVADIEEGVISSNACVLANVALEVGRTLEWDAEAGKVKGDPEANSMLARPYRAPWVHPGEILNSRL